MTDEHIEKTKSAVESAGNIPADKKAELLDLLSKLKPAIAKVFANSSRGCPEHRPSGGGFDPGNDSRPEKTGPDQEIFARTETIGGKI
jgi:hypothetical protein